MASVRNVAREKLEQNHLSLGMWRAPDAQC